MQRQSFDNYASSYDADFTFSSIGKVQREQVYKHLLKELNRLEKNSFILELNCGTGYDADMISKMGFNVLATDASEAMIGECYKRNSKAKFIQSSFNTINEIGAMEKPTLVFSNFGGLNCATEMELRNLSNDLNSISKSSTELLFVIMGRKCLWERFYFKFKKQKQNSMRRLENNGVSTTINEVDFMTYYYSPNELADIFSKHYKLVYKQPIGFFVPPSYLNPFFAKRKFLLSVLRQLDNFFCLIPGLSNYSDHYIVKLKSKSSIN